MMPTEKRIGPFIFSDRRIFVRGSLKKERRYIKVSLRDTRGYDLAADLPGLLRIDFDTEIDLLLLLSP